MFSSVVDVPPPPTSNHPHKPLVGAKGSIIYTETDEAPALATFSLLPVFNKVIKISKYLFCEMPSKNMREDNSFVSYLQPFAV